MWEYRGQKRPPFAETPATDQESVWDYPRPPLIEKCSNLVLVSEGGKELARSTETYRVLETASPPGYYIPEKDVDWEQLKRAPGSSVCEWKGIAVYWGLASSDRNQSVGWSYPEPTESFKVLRGYVSFYPGRVDCFVDGEKVRPQDGHFYGGWITSKIAGPFKGAPGTGHC